MDGTNQSKKQVTKRCHWVPQSYLRAFSADTAGKKIWRFSKNESGGDPELKPIEKVAVKFYLYSPKDSITGVPDDSMERKLSDLEQFFGSGLWELLCTDRPDFAWEPLRKMIALTVAVMYLRNPAHLNAHRDSHRKIVDAINALGDVPTAFEHNGKVYETDVESWPKFRDASEIDIQKMWLKDLNSAAWYAEELLKMRWTITCSDAPVFITTDNPVTFLHPSLQFKGVNNLDTSVTFPISPTRLLTMDHLHGEPANAYYQLQGNGAAQNLCIWRGANEYMFSRRHPDEVSAEMIELAERLEAKPSKAMF